MSALERRPGQRRGPERTESHVALEIQRSEVPRIPVDLDEDAPSVEDCFDLDPSVVCPFGHDGALQIEQTERCTGDDEDHPAGNGLGRFGGPRLGRCRTT